jgi:hypothetical protein
MKTKVASMSNLARKRRTSSSGFLSSEIISAPQVA